MFEVFEGGWDGGRPWRRRDTLVLSAGVHALLIVGAAYVPASVGVADTRGPPVETVTFFEILQRPERPAAPGGAPAGSPAPVLPRVAEDADAMTLTLTALESALRDLPLDLPDLAPRDGLAAALRPGEPEPPLAIAAGFLADGQSSPWGGHGGSGGDAVDLSRVAERPVLRNAGEMEFLWKRLYPRALNRRNIEGEAVVSFVIGTDGRVDPITIRLISASHPEFGEATVRGVRKLRFRPARIGGQSVRVRAALPIHWRLKHVG